MANKVKVVGYAKKLFYNDGIEYRNFSPDLVGNQSTSYTGNSVFTSGDFSVTTNLDSKVDKRFVTKDFGDFKTLDALNNNDTLNNIYYLNNSKINLNLDSENVLNYAFFGSLTEYVRVSLENIIINWPASLFVSPYSTTDTSVDEVTVENYNYNSITNISTFTVNTDRLINQFSINYQSNGSIINTFNETNDLRNLAINYESYVISNKYGDFNVIGFIGASDSVDYITLTAEGNPFPLLGSEKLSYHIKPNGVKYEEFLIQLNQFESNLLNTNIIPKYTASFTVFSETDKGGQVESTQHVTWPVTDGYNIDFSSSQYVDYVNKLLELAETSDLTKSNLMTRFLVSKSITEFDTSSDDVNQKMTNALRVYGRSFDELRAYMNGISFANVVTYNKKDNTPDLILKNLSRVMGWDLISSIEELDLVDTYLKPNDSGFEGMSRGFTNAEAEIELWRRVILNTPWIWKSKGTRKAIEFLFKFMGAPDGLVTFNEYVYVAAEKVEIDYLKELMVKYNGTDDITYLNVDDDGYPKVLEQNSDMYFQKAGLWYRTTGGDSPDVDVLYGNNPHIGPYDGGQAYIDQFTGCLVPNYEPEGGTIYTIETSIDDLYVNNDDGTFGLGCDEEDKEIINNVEFKGLNGMDVNCLTMTSVVVDDDDCNGVLEINVYKAPADVVTCNYTSATLEDDGYVLLHYPDNTTTNVHPECCAFLSEDYTSELGPDNYMVCRWLQPLDTTDCANYELTSEFDGDYAVFNWAGGGTTTTIPKTECCGSELVSELTSEGTKCKEPYVDPCSGYVMQDNPPSEGYITFTYNDNNTQTVPSAECCGGYSSEEVQGGYLCYEAYEKPSMIFSLESACCDTESTAQPVQGCSWWTIKNTSDEQFRETVEVLYADCYSGLYITDASPSAGSSITFAASSIEEVDLGDSVWYSGDGPVPTQGPFGTLTLDSYLTWNGTEWV